MNEVFDVATESNFQLRSKFQKKNVLFERLIAVNTLCLIFVHPFGIKHSNVVKNIVPFKKYFLKELKNSNNSF